MESWVFLAAFYGLAKGLRECIKKAAVKKSNVIEVLFFYTAFAFVLTTLFSHNIFGFSASYHVLIVAKSLACFFAWICAFNSIKNMPVSIYGVIDSSRMIFSAMLAVLFLGETMTGLKIIGFVCVSVGVIVVNIGNKSDEKVGTKYLAGALLSCFLNALSGFLDKKILTLGEINSSQLQFWFMFYMTLLYLGYVIFARIPIKLSTIKSNYWIILMSVIFVLADRMLFLANEDPQSQVTVMTLLKQSSVIVTVITGWFVYKEKDIFKRTICALVVLIGIVVATL